jgi:hypothetical protein
MAPHDDEDDPAVYRSGSSKKAANDAKESNLSHSDERMGDAGSDVGTEDGDDGTLLTVQPGFNRLLLVLRDEGVMRFVKYISAAAEGSRWDICGEYEVGKIEEDSDTEDT